MPLNFNRIQFILMGSASIQMHEKNTPITGVSSGIYTMGYIIINPIIQNVP